MVSRVWTVPLAILAFLPVAAANAQSFGPDEAVGPHGSVRQELALTAAQRSAIYNAVLQQGHRPSSAQIPVAVGAPVPRSAELSDLPDPTGAGGHAWIKSSASDLKYAMVEDDVVVIDPRSMQVVDVIHGSARR